MAAFIHCLDLEEQKKISRLLPFITGLHHCSSCSLEPPFGILIVWFPDDERWRHQNSAPKLQNRLFCVQNRFLSLYACPWPQKTQSLGLCEFLFWCMLEFLILHGLWCLIHMYNCSADGTRPFYWDFVSKTYVTLFKLVCFLASFSHLLETADFSYWVWKFCFVFGFSRRRIWWI